MTPKTQKWFAVATGSTAAVAVLSTALLLPARPARATAQFAAETGQACGACHTAPGGGGPLTPLGEKFKANGNKMPK